MKKIISILLAALFAISCFSMVSFAGANDQLSNFSISAAAEGASESIKVDWYNVNGKYYLFVPASIGTEAVKVDFEPADATVKADGAEIACGDVISLAGKSSIKIEDAEASYDVVVIAESKTASVFIETESGSLDYIHAVKGNEEEGTIVILGADGSVEYDGTLEIKGRGNSTWQMEKKPYNFKIDKKTNLFGMGKTKKWSLIANHTDASLIRNVLAYEAAERAGMPYNPQFTPVDVYINNEYMGAYLLTTRIGIDPSNVDIEDLEGATEDANEKDLDTYPRAGAYGTYAGLLEGTKKWFDVPNDPEDITGGYIIEMELANRYADELSGFVTTRSQPFTMKTPEVVTEAQINYISDLYQKFEDAVYAGADMATVGQYCNVESLAQMYIINEWASNMDASLTSTYFYKPAGENETLYGGPVWDFDIGFGNNDGGRFGNDYSDPTKWTVCYNRMYRNTFFGKADIDEQPTIYNVITKNAGFIAEVEKEWNSDAKAAIADTIAWAKDTYVPSIEGSAVANAIRWNIFGTENVAEIKSAFAAAATDTLNFATVKSQTMDAGIGEVHNDAPQTNPILKALKSIPVAMNQAFEKFIVLFNLANKI